MGAVGRLFLAALGSTPTAPTPPLLILPSHHLGGPKQSPQLLPQDSVTDGHWPFPFTELASRSSDWLFFVTTVLTVPGLAPSVNCCDCSQDAPQASQQVTGKVLTDFTAQGLKDAEEASLCSTCKGPFRHPAPLTHSRLWSFHTFNQNEGAICELLGHGQNVCSCPQRLTGSGGRSDPGPGGHEHSCLQAKSLPFARDRPSCDGDQTGDVLTPLLFIILILKGNRELLCVTGLRWQLSPPSTPEAPRTSAKQVRRLKP